MDSQRTTQTHHLHAKGASYIPRKRRGMNREEEELKKKELEKLKMRSLFLFFSFSLACVLVIVYFLSFFSLSGQISSMKALHVSYTYEQQGDRQLRIHI